MEGRCRAHRTATVIPMKSAWCVVVAGGSGSRFGGYKQFEILAGRRVVDISVATAREACDGVVVVMPAGALVPGDTDPPPADVVVEGGPTRTASAHAGLDAVPEGVDIVLIHDAARPLASVDLFRRVIDAVAEGAEAVVPVVEVTDTIRTTDAELVDRSSLRAVQTPQGFFGSTIRAAHDKAAVDDRDSTDDAALAAGAGAAVVLIEGESTNIKLTDSHDLAVAEVLLRRSGSGGSPLGSRGRAR